MSESIAFKALILQLIYGETVERCVTKGLIVLIALQRWHLELEPDKFCLPPVCKHCSSQRAAFLLLVQQILLLFQGCKHTLKYVT